MEKGSRSSSSKFSRCIKAPAWVLRSVRDLYVKGMTVCAGQVGQYSGAGVSCPSFAEFTCADNSFSYSRPHDLDKDDLGQVIRTAESRLEESPDATKASVRRRRRRSAAVVGRNDEDRPCEFEEDVRVGSSLLFPRGSSHGAGIKRKGIQSNVLA